MRLRMLAALSFCGVLLLASAPASRAQQSNEQKTPQCHRQAATTDSSHASHEAMMGRGETGMGFSRLKTAHHFFLKSDGGVIAVSVNDARDTLTRAQIRMHLSHIAHAFSDGNFEIPMFVHDQVPAGVPAMRRLSKDIHYRFNETDAGGQVILSSGSAEAVQAIHDFLVFQIGEHDTHDALVVE
jgi:hypothetical protein